MRFKISGLLLLAAAAYFAISAIIGVQQQRNDAITVQVQPLVAIFLILLVRVLQAEKHHRDWLRHASDMGEAKRGEEIAIAPLEEIAVAPLREEELLPHDPVLETE